MLHNSQAFSSQYFSSPDYLNQAEFIDREAIAALRADRQASLWTATMQPYQAAVDVLADVAAEQVTLTESVIRIGTNRILTEAQQVQISAALQTFCPWKKGPFDIFGNVIDSEWRSDWKWERILPHIQPLMGKKVADIGCHNGYFMFRMSVQAPDVVIGFEPVAKHFWNFQLLQNLIRQPNLFFELLGVEHLDLYPRFFDTVFCLGILYHHTDPVGLLRKMHAALVPGGELIIDCQGIPGDLPIALTPQKRYAKARGIWFLPTQSCLENWIKRAGFQQIEVFFAEPLSIQEQRRTPWADVDSLQEFLDPSDPTRTVEGYPAPWRYYVIARR